MNLTRRLFFALAGTGPQQVPGTQTGRLDRQALVQRHNVVLTGFQPRSPLSVGNGEFAFTLDPTGLQTFPQFYENECPLCTQSQWGWHSFPPLKGLGPDDLRLSQFDTHGRPVGYPVSADGQRELFSWLRENPHRLNLGRIGLVLTTAEGARAKLEDIRGIRQELDLWSGSITSRFEWNGDRVQVETCCHPETDAVAVRIRRSGTPPGRLGVEFDFPYGSPGMAAADWGQEQKHRSEFSGPGERSVGIGRRLDGDRYAVAIEWRHPARFSRTGAHRFVLEPGGTEIEFICSFAPGSPTLPTGDVFRASADRWSKFWEQGGALELAAADPRAKELERRVVLSQYQTAIQCAGSMPPQETGLTCNSWYGKFHLEMHWWHAAHFPLWGRTALLERSLGWYGKILPEARKLAARQGYRGARWPKMVGPEGRDSPSPIGPLLIWQQPHIIVLADLCRRSHGDRKTLERYADLVFESADFMASYASWDGKRYVLGPPLIPAQENHSPRETWNPAFELEYWDHGLRVAQQWRARLGLPANAAWEQVREGLAALPERAGVYLAHENCPQTYTERNRDHPSMVAALGMLPGRKADAQVMRRTLDKVLAEWRWPDTWGWDYPMLAMTAARLGDPGKAIDALMLDTPKNRWLPNGHTWQRQNLPLYLPSNGGLLAAVALMAAGWEGSPRRAGPGFPDAWKVSHEGLRAWL